MLVRDGRARARERNRLFESAKGRASAVFESALFFFAKTDCFKLENLRLCQKRQ